MDLRAFLPDGPVVFVKTTWSRLALCELPRNVKCKSGQGRLALKHRFTIPNSPGTVDEDYRGCVMVGLHYFGEEEYSVSHGDRIAQAVLQT